MKFQPGNKVAEKWTEIDALKIANELIDWMAEANENIFFKEYLMYNGLYKSSIEYLCKKYNSFSDLIKDAKEIQELKLVKSGVANKLNVPITIFVLKNHHDYKDRSEVDQHNYNYTDVDDDEIECRISKIIKSRKEKGT